MIIAFTVSEQKTKLNRKKYMADALRHHKSRGQKFAFDRQCTAHFSLKSRCKTNFFVTFKDKIFAFGTKMLKNRWQRHSREILFYFCVWKLEQPYVETKLHRKTARPFTVLQVHSSVNHIVIKNSGAEQIINVLLEWTIKAHLISFSMQSLKYIQLDTQHSVLCWQIMVA